MHLLSLLVLFLQIYSFSSREHKIHAKEGEKPERQYIRSVDDGLVYAVIHPYRQEWNSTFRPYEKHVHGVADLKTPSPVHFYFRCVDGVARIYFTIEDLNQRPINNQPMGSELKVGLDIFQDRIKLKIDGKETKYNVWHGGADVQVDVSNKPRRSYLRVQVNDWAQYTAFPMNRCERSGWNLRQVARHMSSLRHRYPSNETVRSALHNANWAFPNGTLWIDPLLLQRYMLPDSSVYASNEIVVHLHTFDMFITHEQLQNEYLIEGIAKHMIYHRCALNVSRYEVVIQHDHLEQYMANKHLAQFVKEGWLVFLIKGHRPARLNFGNCNWQGLYENMALLRYWRSKKHVMFWNADEYLVYNKSFTPESFRSAVVRTPAAGFRRYVAFCQPGNSPVGGCVDGVPEVVDLSLTQNTYLLGEKLRDLKLILNPDFVGCLIMHWAGCGSGLGDRDKLAYRSIDQVHRFANSTAYIAHFENLFYPRWKRSTQHQQWMFNKLDRAIDKLAFPVVTQCDPNKLHNFKTKNDINVNTYYIPVPQ